MKNEYPRAMELISDIFINSNFPEKEMNREKEVIIDEINSYKDAPGELIFDDFEEMIFPDHPIGRNILGTPESLRNFSKKEIELLPEILDQTVNGLELILTHGIDEAMNKFN